MAYVNGVYHPQGDDTYNPTGSTPGAGDLGQMASTAGAGIQAVDAKVEQYRYPYPPLVPAEVDIDTLGVGVYGVSSTGNAEALGLPVAAPGTLTVNNASNVAGARTQMYHAIPIPAGSPSRIFVRNLLFDTWSEWTEMADAPWYRGTVSPGTDLNTVVVQGTYGMNPPETILNRPIYDGNGAVLEVFRHGTTVLQRYTSMRATDQTVWVRRGNDAGATWFAWTKISQPAPDESSGGGSSGRREMLQQQLRARKGNTIGTGGRGVVALRFDDAAGDFARDVLPLLEERGLPFTRVTTVDRVGNTAGGEDDTWANIQAYCLRSGGEVWNHGKTHGAADSQSAIDAEIVGALASLRANLPRLVIDCWTPPGGQSTGWGGYMPAETIEQIAGSYAGQLIMSHHAIATGYMPDSWYVPVDGTIRDGQIYFSSDARTVNFLKDRIDRAGDYPCGIVLMWHANNIDGAGYISMADFEEVLDYVVAQRDAGNILVLTVSGMAVADAESDVRHDLLKTHGGAGWSESAPFPNFRSGILGSTRELTATVTGTPSGTVTSTVGESVKTHTIPGSGTLQLRHPVTIPNDITTLPVSISGGTSADVHLYAV